MKVEYAISCVVIEKDASTVHDVVIRPFIIVASPQETQ